MGRHNKNGRPVAGGGRDPTDGKDRLRFYSEPERRASLSLVYLQPEWMGQLERHPEPPRRATRWRSNGKVIRVDMKPDDCGGAASSSRLSSSGFFTSANDRSPTLSLPDPAPSSLIEPSSSPSNDVNDRMERLSNAPSSPRSDAES